MDAIVWIDARGCELFCTVVYVHVYMCTLYSWHYFFKPFFALLCVPSVLCGVLLVSSVWRLGKGTLIARVRVCWNEMGSFAVGDLV